MPNIGRAKCSLTSHSGRVKCSDSDVPNPLCRLGEMLTDLRGTAAVSGRNAGLPNGLRYGRAKCSDALFLYWSGEMLELRVTAASAREMLSVLLGHAAAVGRNARVLLQLQSGKMLRQRSPSDPRLGDLGSAPVEGPPNLFWTGVPEVYRLGQGRSACSWSHAVHAELPA